MPLTSPGRTIRDIYRHANQQRQALAQDTRQSSWLDWLQCQAQNGRMDALQALRARRRSALAPKHLSPVKESRDNTPEPPGAQITKEGAIIETVAGHAIRRDEAGIYVEDQDGAPDEVLLAVLHHATTIFGSTLKTFGLESFQLRLANRGRILFGLTFGVTQIPRSLIKLSVLAYSSPLLPFYLLFWESHALFA